MTNSLNNALPLPVGDHEGIEGFGVIEGSGRKLGIVAAVERTGRNLSVLIQSAGPQPTFRTVDWAAVKRINLDEHTLALTAAGATALANSPTRSVVRSIADDDTIVRFIPAEAAPLTMAPRGHTEPSNFRPILKLMLASLATIPLLVAGALAGSGNFGPASIFLGIALSVLVVPFLAWPTWQWLKTRLRP